MAEELGRLEDPDDPGYRPWARYHADKREEQDARIGGRDVTKILKGLNVKKTTVRWGPEDGEYVPGEDRDE